jgi:AraC-like DNA-binding protein
VALVEHEAHDEHLRLPTLPEVAESGELPLWPPLLATRGPGSLSAPHAHHAMHFVLALKGELQTRTSASAPWVRAAGVLTAADAVHSIDARGVEVLLVFLDPESQAGSALARLVSGPLRVISGAERALLMGNADARAIMQAGGAEWTRRAVQALGAAPIAAPRTIHPRVRKALKLLRAATASKSLEALAAAVGLSPGRLMHVFTSSIGIPLRPYLTWLKLQRAAGAIASGRPLTEAAHAAGFSDGAHLSRTFRSMFGVAPSALRPRRTTAS